MGTVGLSPALRDDRAVGRRRGILWPPASLLQQASFYKIRVGSDRNKIINIKCLGGVKEFLKVGGTKMRAIVDSCIRRLAWEGMHVRHCVRGLNRGGCAGSRQAMKCRRSGGVESQGD